MTTEHEPAADSHPAPPALRAAEIILDHIRRRLRPTARKGASVRCHNGRWVRMGAVCPDSAMIAELAGAADAPVWGDGRQVVRQALPALFREWFPVAWGDLLGSLPLYSPNGGGR